MEPARQLRQISTNLEDSFFTGKQAMHQLSIIQGPLKGHAFDLNADPFFIGRSSKNNLQIKDTEVSREQLKIFKIDKTLFIEDLKSTNGTLVNSEKIQPGKRDIK